MRDAVVEEVRSRADLVDICGEFMSLKRVGKTVRGPCPLHGGDDPNFSIDPERQIFKCFVCGEGGDVFSFVMKHLGHDFPDAVRWIGERVGVQVPERGEERGEDPHAPLREAAAFAAEWFADNLSDPDVGASARDYLEDRGIDPADRESHGLGYAPDSWRALREAAHDHGLEDDQLLGAGLLSTSERADEPYDRFRDRLTFAIRDLRGRAVGFGGRDLSGDDEAPKYINSPDSPIFSKGRTLYGLERARHAIRKHERALVVEGYMDAIALHDHGLQNAVAPLGTALTSEQAETLVRYARSVFLLYDSDAPGLRATFKAADRVLEAGGHPMVVTLPEGEDPDSLVRREGIGVLREYLEDAVDALERKLQILERKGYLESIEGRRRAVDGLLSTLRAVSDPALRDLYLDRTADRLGVRRETVVKEVAKSDRRRRRTPRRSGGGPGAPGGPPGPGSGRPAGRSAMGKGAGDRSAERTLLLLFLREPSMLDRALQEGLEEDRFRKERRAATFRWLREAREEGIDGWPPEEPPEEHRELVEELRADPTELVRSDAIFEQALRRLLYRPQLERLDEIDRELELADEEQGRELIVEKQELVRELRKAEVPVSFLRRYT